MTGFLNERNDDVLFERLRESQFFNSRSSIFIHFLTLSLFCRAVNLGVLMVELIYLDEIEGMLDSLLWANLLLIA